MPAKSTCVCLAILVVVAVVPASSAGVATPGGRGLSQELNPLNLSKDDGLGDQCVEEGTHVNYTISFDNVANSDEVHDVVITDYLPNRGIFVSATDGGTYDPNTHAVAWDLGTLGPGGEGAVMLEIRISYNTPDGDTLVNRCEILSAETPVTQAADTTATCPTYMNDPVILTKRPDSADSCRVPGARVRYTIRLTNPPQNGVLVNVYVMDYLAPETEHVANSSRGTYDPVEHKVRWYIPVLAHRMSDMVWVEVQVRPGITPGSSVINTCEAFGQNLLPGNVQDTLLICVDRLASLNVSQVVYPSGNCLPRGNLIYTISYDNSLNAVAVSNVILVDRLPEQTDFVSATGSGTYDSSEHTVTWNLGPIPSGSIGSQELAVKLRSDTPSWSSITNICEISGDETTTNTSTEQSTVCGSIGNPGAKAAVHVVPHIPRTCTRNIPELTRCQDIQYATDSTDVDAFPVFFDLAEYRGLEYGLTWEGGSSCVFTICSDHTIGNITNPGDGISQIWVECQSGPIAMPGWAWIYFDGPARVCVVRHPVTCAISVGDCQSDMLIDYPSSTFCAGVGGAEGENPCGYPTSVQPTTWGAIKSMYR